MGKKNNQIPVSDADVIFTSCARWVPSFLSFIFTTMDDETGRSGAVGNEQCAIDCTSNRSYHGIKWLNNNSLRKSEVTA